jgi:hypothetical protein
MGEGEELRCGRRRCGVICGSGCSFYRAGGGAQALGKGGGSEVMADSKGAH